MPYPVTRSVLRSWAVACAACAVAATIACAQDQPDNTASPPASSADSPAGISIPDSPGAIDKLEKAKEKEDQHQWKTAADFYQEVLTSYARRVMPSKIDKARGVYQYRGIAGVVQERMAKWPDEGLDAYRAAYSQQAADQLTGAKHDDIAALENVFWTYFITDGGKAAGIRLMDLHIEAGQFTAAEWIGNRLLSLHPMLGPDAAMVLYRTALASYWSGDAKAALALLDDLKSKHPNDTGSIGGKDVVLADALATALKTGIPEPTTRPGDADTWPTFGGPGGRGEVSPSTAKPGLNSINIPLAPLNLTGMQAGQQQMYKNKDDQDVAAGEALGIMPAVDGGALFFQDGRHIYAVSTDSGLPLPGWLQTYGGNRGGRYTVDTFGRPRGEQLTVAVTPREVLAVIGQADRGAPLVGQSITASVRLVCLDRTTGKELWSRTPNDLPDGTASLRTADFNGTPLVIRGGSSPDNDSVLVTARGGKGNQFEDCYVVCLSLKSGQFKWSTYVGSASHLFDGDIGLEPLGTSEMCFADGRVFVLSNLGTVAAIDPYDGRMIWLSSYPRDPTDNPEAAMIFRNRMNGPGSGRTSSSKPWSNNPVVVAGGKVFVLPSDGKHLLIYDGGSGAEIKRILLSDYDSADVLLGVKDRAVVLTTEKGCYCLDWTAYDHDNPESAILWARKDAAADQSTSADENIVFGRGFLTADSVFIPTRHRLLQLGWFKGGKLLSTYPSRGQWGGEEKPGNVLVTSQGVIVAGSTRVDIYRDLALVRKQFELRIAASPNDPEPRVEFASALFTGGQADAALQKLDEAVDLIGGPDAMRSGKGRDLIFTTTLNFAERSAKDPLGATDDATTDKLYDRAAAAADSPLQQAMIRLSRAHFDHSRKDFAGEVKLCQEILSDEVMRSVSVSENSTAGGEAAVAIGAAIAADRTAYTAVEQAAADALASARSSGDAAKLLAIATIYPNSKAAAEASQAAAALQETAGDHSAAIETLRQMYTASDDFPVKSRLLESIARNFVAMPGGVGSAIDRLSQGGKDSLDRRLSQALPLPDGTSLQPNVSFADAVAALRKAEETEDVARLPDFRIPVQIRGKDKAFTSNDGAVVTSAAALVRPLRDFPRNDRVAVWSPVTGLSVYPAGETTPVATVASITEEPRGVAWIEKKLLLTWTNSQLLLISDSGDVQWKADLQMSPGGGQAVAAMEVASAKDAVTDDIAGDDPNAMQNAGDALVINGGARIIIQGNRRIFVQNGMVRVIGPVNVVQGQPAQPAPAPIAVPAGDQILTVRPAGSRIITSTVMGRLMAVDVADGHLAWQIRLADTPVAQVLANPHFTVARIDDPAGSQLIVFDTSSGRVIGRRKFGGEGTANQLVNAALSEEATLAWTLVGKLQVKDLYDLWKSPPVDLAGRTNVDVTNFSGMTQADQLIVHGGRIIALYDGGKLARVHDLSTPAAIGAVAGGAGEGGIPLATGADARSPGAVSMRLAGSRLFILNGRAMWQYSLEHANDHYNTQNQQFDRTPRIRDMLLGSDHAILLDDPIDRGPTGSSFVQLYVYRRGPISATNPREANKLDYDPLVRDNAGILAWQGVDGGVYYLTGDQKLHWLEARR